MVLSQKINQLEKEYYKNLNIISQALGDQDFIFENIDSDINDDVLAVRDLYLDSEIEDNEKANKLAEYAEKGIYVACYYLFLLNEVLKNNESFDLKKYLILGYKNKNPITTFLYGIYILDIYSTNKKDTDLLKAEQILNEAYNLGVSIALLPIKNLEISNKLLGLKSEIGEKQPIKKQININEEKRDVYLFTGILISKEQTNYNGTPEIRFVIQDDYGNDKYYYNNQDLELLENNKVTIISIDNPDNNIGIRFSNYNLYKNDLDFNNLETSRIFVLTLSYISALMIAIFSFWYGIITDFKKLTCVVVVIGLCFWLGSLITNQKKIKNEVIIKKFKKDIDRIINEI